MAAITVGIFSIHQEQRDGARVRWVLRQGDIVQAEGGLNFVLDRMFERMKSLSLHDIKTAVEQGDDVIKHTITVR